MNRILGEYYGARIVAVDFDGTLCEDRYPAIGQPNKGLIEALIDERKSGSKLILWTCRVDERLREAVEWCKGHGLEFDAVNDNIPEVIEKFGGDTRKIFADVYLDDKNIEMGRFNPKTNIQKWAENEVRLACLNEKEDYLDGEWDYKVACYQSALKAYNSLMEDGYSGYSVRFTHAALKRLMDHKPLTPLTGSDDEWLEYITGKWRNKRYSGLFKEIRDEGLVYSDINRVLCYDIRIDGRIRLSIADDIVNEVFPINFPYLVTDEQYVVTVETFKYGDGIWRFDTVRVLNIESSSGDVVEIGKFFKETAEKEFVEIEKEEYDIRRGRAMSRTKNKSLADEIIGKVF